MLNQYAGGELGQEFLGKRQRFQINIRHVKNLPQQAKHLVLAHAIGGENRLVQRLTLGQQRAHALRARIIEQAFGDESGENGFHRSL